MSDRSPDELRAEAHRLGHYLIGGEISAATAHRYASDAATESVGGATDAFDRFLVAAATRGTWLARGADLYSRFTRPNAWLRRKLILLMALCEVHPEDGRAFQGPVRPGPFRFALGSAVRVTLTALSVLVLLPLLLPAHVVLRGRA